MQLAGFAGVHWCWFCKHAEFRSFGIIVASTKILKENMGNQVEIFQWVKTRQIAPDGVTSIGIMEEK
jgi:hypothetical protein